MHAGQPRKIASHVSEQIQALTRMPRMSRIIHKVFGFLEGSPHIGVAAATAGSPARERLGSQARPS
jgi:hypothetical protein